MDYTLKRSPNFEQEGFPVRITIQENRTTLVSMHWHEEIEFIRVLRGPVLIQLDDHICEAKTGDIIFIENNCTHYVRAIGKTDKAIMGLVFNKELFEEHIMELTSLHSFSSLMNSSPFYYNEQHPLNAYFAACLNEIYEEYTKEPPFYLMTIKGCIYKMMSALLRDYITNTLDDPILQKQAARLNRLQPVLTYIHNNYASSLSLDMLSQEAAMSPYYFSRFFKSIMDCTPIDYVVLYRLKMSIRLLVNSNRPITLIAEDVGFTTCNYYDRAFKETYQMTPSEYRKQYRTN